MTRFPRFLRSLASIFSIFCFVRVTAAQVFELRIYHTFPGKLPELESRFRNHTIAIFNAHGMRSVGYWKPASGQDGEGNRLVYLLEFENSEQRDAAWRAFLDDPDWKRVYAESTQEGRLVERVESVLLVMTDYSPALAISEASPPRLFELRTYSASEGRLERLDARFRDHTIRLFEKHGMQNIAYFHPIEEAGGAGTALIYLLAHESREARDASFKEFASDPDWQSVRRESEAEAGGPLTLPGGVRSQLLTPTDFSMFK